MNCLKHLVCSRSSVLSHGKAKHTHVCGYVCVCEHRIRDINNISEQKERKGILFPKKKKKKRLCIFSVQCYCSSEQVPEDEFTEKHFFPPLAWNLSRVFGKCHEGICMHRALQKVKNDVSHSHVKKPDYICARGDGICNTYVPAGEEIHFS